MSEYLELGPVPCDENCTGTGSENYVEKQNHEMRVYKHQLERAFPDANFRIKRFPHDFGSYGEVVVTYVSGTESEEQAYAVERSLPSAWDDQARTELASVGVVQPCL